MNTFLGTEQAALMRANIEAEQYRNVLYELWMRGEDFPWQEYHASFAEFMRAATGWVEDERPVNNDAKAFADRLSRACYVIVAALPEELRVQDAKGREWANVLNPLIDIIGDLYRTAGRNAP